MGILKNAIVGSVTGLVKGMCLPGYVYKKLTKREYLFSVTELYDNGTMPRRLFGEDVNLNSLEYQIASGIGDFLGFTAVGLLWVFIPGIALDILANHDLRRVRRENPQLSTLI